MLFGCYSVFFLLVNFFFKFLLRTPKVYYSNFNLQYEFQLNYFSYSQYSIISEADRVITFGGHCHYQAPFELDEVTEYKNDEWTLLGTDSQR